MICPHCNKEIQHVCERCGHVWTPRKAERPAVCPRCKDARWDRPRGK